MKVKELIAQLMMLDPNADVVIDDADTHWFLELKKIRNEKTKDYSILVLDSEGYQSVFEK